MAKLAAPSGFRDFLPDQYRKRHELLRRIRETYETFGFEGMDTPAMESLRVFLGKGGGENEKLMFQVLKRGAELERAVAAGATELADLALRFDLTVPLARYYASHRGELPTVFKRYQFGPVWRAERAQHGRFREFIQCDVDVLGSSSMAVEAEVILATATALGALGFTNLRVRLNSRPLLHLLARSAGVDETQAGAAIVAIDKLDKETPASVREELVRKGISTEAATTLLDLYAHLGSVDTARAFDEVSRRIGEAAAPHVTGLQQILELTPPLPSGRLVFDPFLARGMDYYTGPIFEIASDGVPFSLAGGGRFDDLIERLSGVAVPACGFSIGFERVFTLMEERNMFAVQSRAADVLIAPTTTDALRDALEVAADLRSDGLSVDVFPHAAKPAAQYEVADRKRIPFAVIVDPKKGTNEMEVRDLTARKSTTLARDQIATWLRDHLA